MSEEGARVLEIFSAAYESEVASLPVDSPEWATRHRNAINLLDQLMTEIRSRIGSLEDAAVSDVKRIEVMSLVDMREKIREGF